jgi:hypothetical protein
MGLGLTSRLGGEISASSQLKTDFRCGTSVLPLTHVHLPCACGPRSAPADWLFLNRHSLNPQKNFQPVLFV